ncbi:MAG TPA: SEC-C domain-containing protein, partial [Symbiobacteriaceae bacterium]|nr:SEC-C domain-containing protein [Symbiobacteriaceae bacterium]
MRDKLMQIQAVEANLDRWLRGLPTLAHNGEACLRLACEALEEAYGLGNPRPMVRGLQLLAPYWVPQHATPAPAIEQVIADLAQARHALALREFLYYTLNLPGVVEWQFDGPSAVVRFTDPSLARRLFYPTDEPAPDRRPDLTAQILALLHGQDEFELSEQSHAALPLIMAEAEEQLSEACHFLAPDDPAPLGAYTYRDFYAIYRDLLVRALYHRYWALANQTTAPVIMPGAELVHDVAANTGVPAGTCLAVLQDLCYSGRARNAKLHPVYYALYELTTQAQGVMPPHHFTRWDGPLQMLRLTAGRTPGLFARAIAPRIGTRFVDHVADELRACGLQVLTGPALRQLDRTLPDTAMLLAGRAPDGACAIYLCDVSPPIVPLSVREQVRLVGNESRLHAQEQAKRMEQLLATPAGQAFLRSLTAPGAPVHVGILVIAPAVTGICHGEEAYRVLDHRTLQRIIRSALGEGARVLQALADLPAWAETHLEVTESEFDLGSMRIRYPVVSFREEPTPSHKPVQAPSRPGRNDPCPCGSGLKFKKCHG